MAGRGRIGPAGGDAGAIELDVPQPSRGFEQAILSVDARGVTTWSFAPPAERGPDVRGGSGTRTFTIRRTPGAPPEPGTQADRSIFGEAGKHVLKVIAFPVGQALGRAANSYLDQWEIEHQGYGVRDYTTDNYTAPAAYFDGDSLRWEELAKGRTLLFVHGTFSRAHGAFNDLPLAAMKKLPGDVRGAGHRLRPSVDQPLADGEHRLAARADPGRADDRLRHHLPLPRRARVAIARRANRPDAREPPDPGPSNRARRRRRTTARSSPTSATGTT